MLKILRAPFFVRGLAVFAAVSIALGQGALTPTGAPSPSGRTLDQIEPRLPIPASGPFPYTITQKGSYYLTGNVTVASGNAIVIQASDVSLDLGGFTIASTANTLGGSAILLDSGATNNIAIANGFIRGTTSYNSIANTYSGGGFGVGVASTFQGAFAPNGVRVSSLGIAGVGDGIQLNPTSPSNVVEKTTVANVQGVGIRAGVVADSTADRTGGVSIESRSASNVAGSRTTAGDAVLPLAVAPLTRADVEAPRTPIPAGTSTFTISTPGSYVLTGNLTLATGDGIVIAADNVSLDLNGYTIASTASPSSGFAIKLSGVRTNIAISNGHLRGTRVYASGNFSGGGFFSGIDFTGGSPRSVRVSNVSVTGVAAYGINLGTDRASSIVHSTVRTADIAGLQAGTISDSAALEIGAADDSAVMAGSVSNVFVTTTGSPNKVTATDPSVPFVSTQVAGVQTAVTAVQSATATLQTTAAATQVAVAALDPRTSIPGGTAGFTISQPGAYVLKGNLTVAGGNAINITADNVTLDLGGFTITSTAASPSGYGVALSGIRSHVAVSNGHIRAGTTFSGGVFTPRGFGAGIASDTAGGARSVRVSGVSVSGTVSGIDLGTDVSTVIVACTSRTTQTIGLRAGAVSDSAALEAGTTAIAAGTVGNSVGTLTGAGTAVVSTNATVSAVAAQVTTLQGTSTATQTAVNSVQNSVNVANTSLGTVQASVGTVQTLVNDVQASVDALSLQSRKPIAAGSTPVIINQPGSYVLTGNKLMTTGSAIEIQANDVTIDLNGHLLASTSVSPSNGGGVFINGARSNITIRNGHVRGGASYSGSTYTNVGFFHGIVTTDNARNVRVENVSVSNTQTGIVVAVTANNSLVTHCNVSEVATNGITAANVQNCVVTGTGGTAIQAKSVANCRAEARVGHGIEADAVTGCTAVAQSAGSFPDFYRGILGKTVTNCHASHPGAGTAITARVVSNCVTTSNGGSGIFGDSVINSSADVENATAGSTGIQARSATNCSGDTYPNGTGIGVKAINGVSCVTYTTFQITNRYLMP